MVSATESPLSLVVDNSDQVRTEAMAWPDRARAVVIVDDVSYVRAAELTKAIKALRGRIADTFDPHIKMAHDAHKALVRAKADAEAPLTEAEGVLKRTLVAYQEEQEVIRRAEARRLEEEARRAEESRRLDEAAALERMAAETGDESMRATAHEVLDAPVPTIAVPVERATPKVAGISYRDTYAARVTSLPRLIQFVAKNPQFSHLLTPNATAINQLARAQKEMLQIDGLEVVKTKVAAAGGR